MIIVYAIIVLSLLIVIHELGHFLVARAVGVKVHEFSLGMGPKIFGIQRGEILYAIRAFPIGGYVKMEGEDENSEDERAFNNKPIFSRFLVIVAGATMNLILDCSLIAGAVEYSNSEYLSVWPLFHL